MKLRERTLGVLVNEDSYGFMSMIVMTVAFGRGYRARTETIWC